VFSTGAAAVLAALIVAGPATAASATEQPAPPDPSPVTVEPSDPLCICATTPDYGDADFSNEPGLDLPPQPGTEPAPWVLDPPPTPDLSEYMHAQWDAQRAAGSTQVGAGAGWSEGDADAAMGGAATGDALAASAEVVVAAPRVTALPRDASAWRWLQQAPGSLRSVPEPATAAFSAKGVEVERDAAAEEADSLRNRLLMVGLLVVLVIVSIVLLQVRARKVRRDAGSADSDDDAGGDA